MGSDRARRRLALFLLITVSVTAFLPGLAISSTIIQAGNDLPAGVMAANPLAYIAVLISNAW